MGSGRVVRRNQWEDVPEMKPMQPSSGKTAPTWEAAAGTGAEVSCEWGGGRKYLDRYQDIEEIILLKVAMQRTLRIEKWPRTIDEGITGWRRGTVEGAGYCVRAAGKEARDASNQKHE